MKKGLLVLSLFFSASGAWARPLLRVSRHIGSFHESFTIYETDRGEELETNSNYLYPSRLEFGSYSRKETSLNERLTKLNEKNKNAKAPEIEITNLLGWELEIFGEKVETADKRYTLAVTMIGDEVKDSTWKKLETTSARLDFPRLIISRQLKSVPAKIEDLKALEICKTLVEEHLFCLLENGALYLPKKVKKIVPSQYEKPKKS